MESIVGERETGKPAEGTIEPSEETVESIRETRESINRMMEDEEEFYRIHYSSSHLPESIDWWDWFMSASGRLFLFGVHGYIWYHFVVLKMPSDYHACVGFLTVHTTIEGCMIVSNDPFWNCLMTRAWRVKTHSILMSWMLTMWILTVHLTTLEATKEHEIVGLVLHKVPSWILCGIVFFCAISGCLALLIEPKRYFGLHNRKFHILCGYIIYWILPFTLVGGTVIIARQPDTPNKGLIMLLGLFMLIAFALLPLRGPHWKDVYKFILHE